VRLHKAHDEARISGEESLRETNQSLYGALEGVHKELPEECRCPVDGAARIHAERRHARRKRQGERRRIPRMRRGVLLAAGAKSSRQHRDRRKWRRSPHGSVVRSPCGRLHRRRCAAPHHRLASTCRNRRWRWIKGFRPATGVRASGESQSEHVDEKHSVFCQSGPPYEKERPSKSARRSSGVTSVLLCGRRARSQRPGRWPWSGARRNRA